MSIASKVILYIENKGGQLKSPYLHNKQKLEILCENGHLFLGTWANIQKGKWCGICYKNSCVNKEKLEKVIDSKGGRLISDFKFSKEKVEIECHNGHTWKVSPQNIVLNNTWCPYCKPMGKSEEICRIAFETIFKNKFPKFRSPDLKGVCGKPLEFDGFCKELKIAFEHNGNQHYIDVPWFNQNYTKNLRKNDEIKKQYCIDNNIKLIIIPQLHQKIKLDKLIEFICKKADIDINIKELDLSSVYLSSWHDIRLIDAQQCADKHEGKCLSTHFINSKEKLEWQCKEGHTWFADLDHIKNSGNWCPKCAKLNKTIYIEDKKEIIIELYKTKSMNEISEILLISPIKISNALKCWNIKNTWFKEKPSRDYLYNLFVIEGKSRKQISEILKKDYADTCAMLKNMGIK